MGTELFRFAAVLIATVTAAQASASSAVATLSAGPPVEDSHFTERTDLTKRGLWQSSKEVPRPYLPERGSWCSPYGTFRGVACWVSMESGYTYRCSQRLVRWWPNPPEHEVWQIHGHCPEGYRCKKHPNTPDGAWLTTEDLRARLPWHDDDDDQDEGPPHPLEDPEQLPQILCVKKKWYQLKRFNRGGGGGGGDGGGGGGAAGGRRQGPRIHISGDSVIECVRCSLNFGLEILLWTAIAACVGGGRSCKALDELVDKYDLDLSFDFDDPRTRQSQWRPLVLDWPAPEVWEDEAADFEAEQLFADMAQTAGISAALTGGAMLKMEAVAGHLTKVP